MEDASKMDAAALVAAEELKTMNPDEVAGMAAWWAKHFQSAGHKRLGRVLLATRPKPCKAEADG